MGLSAEDAMEQYDSWDSFLMHHSGWFVEEDGDLVDWGALPTASDDDAEAASWREHVEMPAAGRINPEGLAESAAFHTTDDDDGPFYPDDFISFEDE